MEPFRCAGLQPRSGGRGGLRQGDCMTKDRSGRLTGHPAHEGSSNPSGRKHAHILKVREVWSKKLGQSLHNWLIKPESVNFISYIVEATEDFWERRMQFTKYSKNQKDDCDDYCG